MSERHSEATRLHTFSFMLLMDRGLVSTQSGLEIPLALGLIPRSGFDFPRVNGVPMRGEAEEWGEAETAVEGRERDELFEMVSSTCRRLGVSGASDELPERASFSALLSFSLAFALRRSVARSGLLAVPGARYIERRFVCNSVSSAS